MANVTAEFRGLEELLAKYQQLLENLDQFFLCTMAIFVFFMHAGFAFLESGSVRSKNATNSILKNLLNIFIGGIAYWSIGFAFAYGEPGNFFVGHNHFFSTNVVKVNRSTYNMVSRYTKTEIARKVLELTEEELQDSNTGLLLPSSYFAFWFFQFVFAISATAITSGAMAERMNTIAYVIYSFFMTGFIYPIVSHWCWSKSGWLKSGLGTGLSFQDFAGSGVVHMTGGTAALVGAAIIGPRAGRFHEDGTIIDYPGHSVPLTSLGGFILFTGFFAFNGGSVLTLQSPEDGVALARAITNTAVAGSGGSMTAMFLSKLTDFIKGGKHYWSLIWIINGGLAGMISVCASCNDLHPWSALLIGIIAGAMLLDWHYFLCYLQIDDPLDAVGVHLGGGLCGIILGPLFAVKGLEVDGDYVGGVVFGGGAWAWKNWGWNLAGAGVIIVWTATCTSVLFGSLSKAGILRVSQDIEHHGSDRILHNEPAYPKENYYADGEEGLLLREMRNEE